MTNEVNPIYKGDDTGAFGNNFITINLDNPMGFEISKAQFVINGGTPYIEPVENPVFPYIVNLTSEQTQKLKTTNIGKLVVWDSRNRQKECNGSIEFYCKNGVLTNVRRTCC